jgi:hypothetical protein
VKIYKYPLYLSADDLEARAAAEVTMPVEARVLHFGFQGSMATLWALVEPGWAQAVRTFEVYPTGSEVPDDNAGYSRRYVGTAFQGPFVWHCFERVG